MPRRALQFALVVVIGVLAISCAGDRPTLLEEGQTVDTTTTAPSTTTTPGAERRALRLQGAIDQLLAAGSYRFAATVSIVRGEQATDMVLAGWVDGEDRELTLRNGAQATTTRVIDGVATVDRNGEVTTVALEAAPSEPALAVLTQIEDISYAPGDLIQGTLGESALAEMGFDVEGSARVTITLVDDALYRYTISADDGAWSIESLFSDIGTLVR